MKIFRILAAIGLMTMTSSAFANPILDQMSKSEKWEHLFTKNGIKTSRLHLDGSSLFAMRGEGVVDFSASEIASAWLREKNWLDKMLTKELGSRENGRVYQEFGIYDNPWPVSDRLFVYEYAMRTDLERKALVIEAFDLNHPSAPDVSKVGIRGEAYARFYLTPVEGGKKTRVDAFWYADPKGSLPNFLVNFIARSFPENTIVGLQEYLVKDKQPDLPVTVEALKALTAGGAFAH
jgi:hypothetical protein